MVKEVREEHNKEEVQEEKDDEDMSKFMKKKG